METEVNQAVDIKAIRTVFSKLGGMFLAGAIISYGITYGVLALLSKFTPDLAQNDNIRLLLSSVAMYGVGMPVIIMLARRIPKNVPADRRVRVHPGHFVMAVFMCYALTYVSNFIGNIITFIISLFKGDMVQNSLANATLGVSPWLLILDVVICAPLVEELVFRRLLLDRIAGYGQGVAILVSGLMFGLFHGNLNQFIYAFAIGAFLAFLYVKTGSLKFTAGIHMAINLFGSLSILLMQHMDLEEYLRVFSSADVDGMMDYMMQYKGIFFVFLAYVGILLAVVIMGAVFFIVSLATKKFTLDKSTSAFSAGARLGAAFGNVGMALYGIFWVGVIIWQLFQ
ncbi:MAG: CPBP family intramembrane metalloprotease [Candidatus Gastranaerophilales bacterium]|nr:CPBP family intramembrane metalloprotease [Candidatus Gastranaerophilales bacterium]